MKKPIIQIASRRVAESIAQLAREQGKTARIERTLKPIYNFKAH